MKSGYRTNAWLAALAAALLPALLYLPTLSYGFVFDDKPLLIENPVIADPQGLREIFTTDLDPKARLTEEPTTNYLRPLFLAFAAGLHDLFGAEPRGWHLAASLLHGLLVLLAWQVLRGEGLEPWRAFLAALIFGFHPAHVQSAAWVSGMQDLLVGALGLAAFLAYRASLRRPVAAPGKLALLIALYALALLAKEQAVGLLLFVAAEAVFFAWLPRTAGNAPLRRPFAEAAALLAVTLAYFGYRVAVLGGLAHRFPTAPPWPEALASGPVALLAYLRDLLFPFDLFLLHPARPVVSWSSGPALLALLGIAVLTAAALWAWRRRPELGRPFLFFVAWLAPSLAIWAVNPEWMVMDRYLLLSSLALGWVLAVAIPPPAGRAGDRAFVGVALGVIVLFGALSLRDMRVYRDPASFWTAAVKADPGSAIAWTEWAQLRADGGDLAAATEALERAVALDPHAMQPRLRRALLLLRHDQALAAVAELEEITRLNPGYLPAWRNLVVARHRLGDGAGTLAALERALQLFPKDPLLWTHRAVLLRDAGRREEALGALRSAVALAPRDAVLLLREALLLAELGRRGEAAEAARRGLALDPAAEIRAQLEPLAR